MIYYFKIGVLPKLFFNKILSLIFVMPDVFDWMHKNDYTIMRHRVGGVIFNRALKDGIPEYYYGWLSIALVVEYAESRLKAVEKERERNELNKLVDIVRELYITACDELLLLFKPKMDITKTPSVDGLTVLPSHVYFSSSGVKPINFFDGTIARCVPIIADRGCGKTIAWLRVCYSALSQGFTVLSFGADKRNELLFASTALTSRAVNTSYYDTLVKY